MRILWAALVLAAAFGARPAEAAPFAYVANHGSNTVSVIDTATNPPTVVATVKVKINPFVFGNGEVAVTPDGKHAFVTNDDIPGPGTVSVIDTATNKVEATIKVGTGAVGVAVTPDGKRVYVTNPVSRTTFGTVLVIDTATNKIVATVQVGDGPVGIAVHPDGKHAYVTNTNSNNVSVIDTASNTVVATVPVGSGPFGAAVTPDGAHVYVANNVGSNTVSVIDTASNTVVATVIVGTFPLEVALTPDGKTAYVTNIGDKTVSVIATATNKVVATVPVGSSPLGTAVTPDGKHAYVTNSFSNNVSVIDTASNKVVATVPVGAAPTGVGIIPDIPFSAFGANLQIVFGQGSNNDAFTLQSGFTLGSASTGINPVAQPVTLQIGSFATTIPPGSFKGSGFGPFTFFGVIDGVALEVEIKPTGTKRFALEAAAVDANLTGTKNPVTVRVSVGNNSATASVKADID